MFLYCGVSCTDRFKLLLAKQAGVYIEKMKPYLEKVRKHPPSALLADIDAVLI